MTWVLSAFADEAGPTAEDQIKALKRAGYSHIDIRGIDGHNITVLPQDKAREIRRKLDDAGIKVAMYGSPIGKIDIADDVETDLAKLRHLGGLIDIFDCKAVRMFSYYNKGGASPEKWQSESLSRLGKLKAEAGKLGLVLYHENESHIFGDHPAECAVIARELRDGKTFRMIFDFSNFNMGGDDVWAGWELLQPVTDCFHLKDSDANRQHVLMGQGAGHAKRILADAIKRGWHGPLTLEPHLSHSKAVMATGPSGKANEAFSAMSQADSFHAAAQAAKNLLKDIGAPVV